MAQPGRFTLLDCHIFYLNFAGREGPYNNDRTFCVALPDEDAEKLAADGWNVKVREAREEGDEEIKYLAVKVSYENRPPRITMITSTGSTLLKESQLEMLDYADIVKVDIVVNPYEWHMSDGKTGIKAYLKTMFITIDEDDLERMYAENPPVPEDD
jgi:hypothetical protein